MNGNCHINYSGKRSNASFVVYITKNTKMSSETHATLPVIDFSKHDLKPGTPEWDSVKVQVLQALKEHSCFEALFDKVLVLRESVFGAVEELFDLPLEAKLRCVSEKPFRGYRGRPTTPYESMAIDDGTIAESVDQCLTNILWPQGNTNFSKTMQSFAELASGLEKTIRRMILESFGLEKYMDEHMDFTNYDLRVIKYKGSETGEPIFAMPPHCDQNMITLLYPNENGLEIQMKDGEWILVKSSPDCFIVLLGESLSVWLNGRLSPAKHRVIMTDNKARYTAGLFSAVRGGYQVKPPKEVVDEANPLLFKPFDYEEFAGIYRTQVDRGVVESGLRAHYRV
ncbi:hypothetical protein REPUB_Repub13aG0253800 [Reevesia pubescens]